jgi:hypothetical protein
MRVCCPGSGNPLVQARVAGAEVCTEPIFETLPEGLHIHVDAILVIIHEIPNIVQQALVIGLVPGDLVVAMLAHETLLQREMGRDGAEQIAEDLANFGLRPLRGQCLVELVRLWRDPEATLLLASDVG